MVVQRLSADGIWYPLIPVETPELDNIPRGVIPFLGGREYQFFVFPCDLPRREFARSNLKAREIPLMQAEKIRLGHFPERLALIGRDIVVCPLRHIRSSRFPIHLPSHYITHELPQCFPMPLPEGIGIAQRLPHGRVPFSRPLIGP